MPYVLAFAGGLAGSLHCIGMCGGLVAIVASASPARSWGRVLVYNLSRVSMLGAIGALAGALGATAIAWGPLALAQRLLAVAAGAVMTIVGLEVLGVTPPRGARLAAWVQSRLGQGLGDLLRAPSLLAPLAFGALNAFLPCHLIYAFAAMAAGTGSVGRGYLTMLAFGLGTVPAMLAPAAARAALGVDGAGRVQRMAGALVVAVGLVTMLRGVGVSPTAGGHVH